VSEVPSPASAVPDPLEAGRAAIARNAWSEAFELLSAAERQGELSGPDLESLALAAFFVARPDDEDAARERAFNAYLASGDQVRAAYTAIQLARDASRFGRLSIASGWVRRAERLLGGEGDTYAHGYLALSQSEIASTQGDIDTALALAERAVAIGTQATDADLRAWALAHLGELKIARGATPEGIGLLEEASVAAVNGELSPIVSGVTACRMISACRDLSDYRRASEWIEATERYCERRSLKGFPGVCRVHRAEVSAIGGAWEQAETDLMQATAELERYRATEPQADGLYAIGDIRRLRGDFDGAQEALRQAHALGRSPQPALALIRLAQGNVKGAVAAIQSAVGDAAWNRWARARLAPAQVEILVAVGDVPAARSAVEEMRATLSEYPSRAMEAALDVASGRVLLAEGDAAAAARDLRAAIRAWREVGAPYEIARARVVLAEALRALDDEEDAELELRAALEEFRRLGATVDAAKTEWLVSQAAGRGAVPEQVRATFMFTDIVGSTRLAEALGDAAWDRLLQWHDDTLRARISDAQGQVVNSTGDGFFVTFMSARNAVDCAIAIQRALREHRESVGFAPPIRIGLHTAAARRHGTDYSGVGVHVAARVGALAEAGEILATVETLAEAGVAGGAGSREVAVKGVSTPLTLAAVPWD
jgi:class 3 adenylate cyclase